MTKTLKMSLVAAVAVAGLTSTASAQSVESAIKNVDVKGYFQYRYNKAMTGDAKSIINERKFRVAASAKANDTVTLKLRATDLSDGTESDGFDIDRKEIQINAGAATVVLGKISDPSPFTDGTGVKGQYVLFNAAKNLTLAAAYYNWNQGASDASDADDIVALAAIGSADSINYALWYASHKDTNNYLSLIVNAKFAGLGVEAAYASKTDESAANTKDQTQARLMVSTEVSSFSVKAGVVMAGKDGADVALADGSDSKVDFGSSKLAASTGSDTTGVYLNLGAKISPAVSANLEYFKLEDNSDLTLKVGYQIASNLSSYVRYSMGDYSVAGDDTTDDKDLRIQVKYSF